MTILANGGITRQRRLTIQVKLSRALADLETLRLFNSGVDIGAMTRIDSLTYKRDFLFSGGGDPATTLSFVAQVWNDGQPVANAPAFQVVFADPPRAEIVYVEAVAGTAVPVGSTPVGTTPVGSTPVGTTPPITGSFILMEDGTPILLEDGTPIFTENQA